MYKKIWNKDFIFLISSNFLMYITYYAVISALPLYLVSELHASKSQVGTVVAAYTIASVLTRPFSGFTLDKFSRRLVFLIALVVYSLLFMGYLVAISISAIILLRFVQGISWSFTSLAGATIAVDIIPQEKRGEGIGYFALSTTLAMSVGPVVGLLICQHWGYVAVFVTGLFFGLCSLICAYAVHLPKRFLVGRHIELKLDHLFDKHAIRPSLNVLIIMSTYGGLLSFVALYGKELGIHNSSLFFLMLSIGIASARIFTGKSFDRNVPSKIITNCLLLLIVCYPILAIVKNAAGFYFSAIVIGFGIGVVFPTFQSMINKLADASHRGAANSTLYTAMDLGVGLGMLSAGFIAQHIYISAIFLISAIVCLLGLLFFRFNVLRVYESSEAPSFPTLK